MQEQAHLLVHCLALNRCSAELWNQVNAHPRAHNHSTNAGIVGGSQQVVGDGGHSFSKLQSSPARNRHSLRSSWMLLLESVSPSVNPTPSMHSTMASCKIFKFPVPQSGCSWPLPLRWMHLHHCISSCVQQPPLVSHVHLSPHRPPPTRTTSSLLEVCFSLGRKDKADLSAGSLSVEQKWEMKMETVTN
ncbi:hypothetical protein P7K49_039476 [Saguinus oedipus]|uniref:Uncharacterized protein n=1 Tax=Saguinus oedipus TaxID=9490 RepID=A0ABQ9TBZ5_SAGOE|nr:hypothetical protein P7K49_039476 [Saguinus oedipus]